MSTTPIVDQLIELRNEPETDDFGIARPNEDALHRARRLLIDAEALSELRGRAIPRGCVSTNTEGGIRIDWLRPAAAVCLIVGAAKESDPYIYREISGDYFTEPATPEALVRWLHEMEQPPH